MSTNEVRGRGRHFAIVVIGAVSLTILGKVSAFLKDVVLAYFFGVSVSTDAYFIANVIPGLLWATIYTTIGMVFLPIYVEKTQSSDESVHHYVAETIQIYSGLALAVTVICMFAAGPIVRFTAAGALPQTLELARQLTLIMAFGFTFSGYVGIQNAIQQANGRFLAPLAVPVVNNLIATAGIALGNYFGGIRLAVIAAVLGWVIQAPIQRLQTRRYYSTRFRVRMRRETVNRMLLLAAPVMIGVLLDQLNIYVGIYLAAQYGEGAISHLNYATRLATFLASVFSWLVAYFFFPRVASAAARRDDARMGSNIAVAFGLIALLTAPLVLTALLYSDDIIFVIYRRGAYTSADVAATAGLFTAYSYGVMFIAFREMLNRIFFSYQFNYVPLTVGIAATVINLSASYLLSERYGMIGIGAGAAIAAFCYSALEFGILFYWRASLITKMLASMFAAVLLASLIAYGVGTRIALIVTTLAPFARLLVGAGTTGLIYLATVALTGYAFGLRPHLLVALLRSTDSSTQLVA
jgi:putative peptidoglycan lipid II flippase